MDKYLVKNRIDLVKYGMIKLQQYMKNPVKQSVKLFLR